MNNVSSQIIELLKQIDEDISKKDIPSVEYHYNLIRNLAINKNVSDKKLLLMIQDSYNKIVNLANSMKPAGTSLSSNINSASDVVNSNSENINSISAPSDNVLPSQKTEQPQKVQQMPKVPQQILSQQAPQSKQASTAQQTSQVKKTDEEYDPDRISQDEFEDIEKKENKNRKRKDDNSALTVAKEKEYPQFYDFKSISKKISELNDLLNELMVKTEKNDGKWERQSGVNEGMNNTIMLLKEDIGSFRSSLIIREKAADKMESTFERLKDMVESINPEKVNRRFEKMDTSIETISAKFEKNDMLVTKNAKDVAVYKETMSKIKNYDNLFTVLEDIKSEINQVQKVKADADRIASKMEVMFSEVNRKLRIMDNMEQKMLSFEELLKDNLKNVDIFETKLKDTVKESSLSELASEIDSFKSQIANFNEKMNDFGLDIINTNKNINKIGENLQVVNDTLLKTESKQFQFNIESNSKMSKQVLDDVIDFENNKLKNLLVKFESEINLAQKESARKTYEQVEELLVKLAPVSKANVVEQIKRTKELIEKYNSVINDSLSQLDNK